MIQCGIYSITNRVNGKRYFGSATNWCSRRSVHRGRLRRGTHANRHLQAAWKKYGEESFVFKFELAVHEPFLLFVEQIYLDNNPGGYNISRCASAPTRGLKLPAASKERKRKIGNAHRGRKCTEETKAKMRSLQKTLGKKWTDEHKAKTRASLLGKKHPLARRLASSIGHGRGYFKRRNAYRVTCMGHRCTVHSEAEAIAKVAEIRAAARAEMSQ